MRWVVVLISLVLLAAGVDLAVAQGFGFGWGSSIFVAQLNSPINTVVPVINAANLANGSGGAISVSTGTWQNCSSCTYNYQWYTEQPGTTTTTGRITQTAIAGATSASYTPATCSSSPCPLLYATVSATNAAGTGYSIPVQLVGPEPLSEGAAPVNTVAPSLGSLSATLPFAVGVNRFSVSNGTWSNAPVGYFYQWEDSASFNCSSPTNISGATQQTYAPQTSDIGDYVCVTVTAYNSQGSASASTTSGGWIPASTAAPSAGASWPPTITAPSPLQVGSIVSIPSPSTICNTFDSYFVGGGGVNFPPAASCTYQWYDWNGSTATPIAGANQNFYLVQTSDIGYQLEVSVTGSNNFGTATLSNTAPTTSTVAAPTGIPVNSALDTLISSCATTDSWVVGCILKVTLGTWSNTPTAYNYQWLRNGSPISGATNYEYTMAAADQGSTISLQVIAQNNVGNSATETTAATSTVMNGSVQVNAGGSGYTTGNQTLTYSGAGCSDPPTITASVSGGVVTSATFRSGYCASGSWPLNSTSWTGGGGTGAEFTVGYPINTAVPTITGKPVQGGLLTASTGTYTNNPNSFTYSWSGAGSPTNASTYTVVAGDLTHTITVTVTPTNANTTGTSATSAPTATVTNPGGLASGCTASISGTTEASQNLTASLTGTGCTGLTYTYAWLSGGSPVGTSSATYTLQESDVGNTLTVAITPTNSVGTSPPFTSSPTATITNPPAPSGGSVVATTNSPLVSQPAAWTNSGWTGLGTITYTYETCVGTWTGSSCSGTLSGWPGQTYVPSASDVGLDLTYIVIATNLGGSTTAYATASSVVANPAASTNSIAPAVVGTAEVGNDLVSTVGQWTSSQTQFTFQWCSSGITHTSVCATGYGPISGATKQIYTLQSTDQSNTIEVGVTAVNPTVNVTAFSPATSAVAAFPVIAGGCGGWASSTFYDGCKGAPPSGPYTVQHANFFSGFAQRSGQTYPSGFGCKSEANCHPPWAVAGVDYPVGVSCGTSCGFGAPGTPTDPLSANANYNGGNPGNCAQSAPSSSAWTASWSSANGGTATYKFTGTFFYIGGKVIISGFNPSGYNGTFINPPLPPGGNNELLTNQTFTVPMAVNPGTFVSAGSIQGFQNQISCGNTGGTIDIGPMDFSGAGNPTGQALSLGITGSSGPCIIHDSLIVFDTNQTKQAGGDTANVFTGCTYVLLRNDTFMVRDTSGAQTPELPAMFNEQIYVWNSVGTNTGPTTQVLEIPFIQQYNAYIGCPARCSTFAGAFESRFNYIDGLNSYTINGSGAHGDGYDTSIYNGPNGFHTPCYCTGGNIAAEKFDTWSLSPDLNSTGTAGAIDCAACGNINVPQGSISGWTTGDGTLHVTGTDDLTGQYIAVKSVITETSTNDKAYVTQCKDASGNIGCNLKQFNSCSITNPCTYTLNTALPACPTYVVNNNVPGQLCGLSYIFPATIDTIDIRNNVWVNNLINANGSAGTGQAVGFPVGGGSSIVGFSYGDYNSFTIKNNYIDSCGVGQTPGQGVWNTGFPSNTCLTPQTPTTLSGAVPLTNLGAGVLFNMGGANYLSGTPTQADNVLMNNGGCLQSISGYPFNPITDCSTTAPP